MERLAEFVKRHLNDDTTRLMLDRNKWPEIDMVAVVNCIESRKKLKGKVQEWYDEPRLVFPLKLSAEQCSSSATASYKSKLAERICKKSSGWSLADLTGGLGVDSWYFSRSAEKVLYCEMQEALCKAARHNFNVLGADNIVIRNVICSPGSIREILEDFSPDIIYLDPARRAEDGKKVFLIEDCTPDILSLKDELFRHSRHILLKLSPMADITMACMRLGDSCREVHIIGYKGECKELLIWMDREWNEEYTISATEIHDQQTSPSFTFRASEEKSATCLLTEADMPGRAPGRHFLFEPGKALMKSGAFNLVGERSGIRKLGRSTHYYIVEDEETARRLTAHGKLFRIMECLPMDKRSMKTVGKSHPYADVTARNIHMDSDALRKRLGVKPGNGIHIFGLQSDASGALLVVAGRYAFED